MRTSYNIPFRNDSGEEIPGFAVMRTNGTATIENRDVLKMLKPDATLQRWYYINGPSPVPIGGYGDCTDDPLGQVLYDTGTPAFGETWGAKPSEWKLTRKGHGFSILGSVRGTLLKRVQARQSEVNLLRGTLDENLEFRAYATVSVLTFNSDDTGFNVEAYDGLLKSGRIIVSGAVVICAWIVDRWVVIAADECPS